MGSGFVVVAPFLVPLVVGVASFFAYKFLGMAKQIGDLHLLKAYGSKEEAALKDLHRKIDALAARQETVAEKIRSIYRLLEKE